MSELRFLKNPQPSQPNAAMVLPADARAMGAVKATRVGGANKKPRTTVRATDCKVTRADGSSYTIASKTGTRSTNVTKRHKVRIYKEDTRTELFRSYS